MYIHVIAFDILVLFPLIFGLIIASLTLAFAMTIDLCRNYCNCLSLFHILCHNQRLKIFSTAIALLLLGSYCYCYCHRLYHCLIISLFTTFSIAISTVFSIAFSMVFSFAFGLAQSTCNSLHHCLWLPLCLPNEQCLTRKLDWTGGRTDRKP